jgi:dienelactone hydrolase
MNQPYSRDLGTASTLDLIADQLAGMQDWMARLVEATAAKRRAAWPGAPVDAWRGTLRQLLGCAEAPVAPASRLALASGEQGEIEAVSAEHGPGLTVSGVIGRPRAAGAPLIVALPPSDVSPEDWFGLTGRLPVSQQLARHLLASGWRVACPRPFAPLPLGAQLTDYPAFGAPPTARDEVWRLATQLGLPLAGFEVQNALACLALAGQAGEVEPYAAAGLGDGGRLSLMLAAVDLRCTRLVAAGAFGDRADPRSAFPWAELIHGWGLRFGDAELAAMVLPRPVTLIDALGRMAGAGYRGELAACQALCGAQPARRAAEHPAEAVGQMLAELGAQMDAKARPPAAPGEAAPGAASAQAECRAVERHERACRQLRGLLDLASQQRERRAFDDLAARRAEWQTLVGQHPAPDAPLEPRGRLAGPEFQTGAVATYEVCVPVYADPPVFVRGLLAAPRDIPAGERLPAVVCAHGWEGTPELAHQPGVYGAFALRLAERGFVTWAPQSYFRSEHAIHGLYRMASIIGKTEFGLMARLHGRALDYLAGLPFVDPRRIAFYGLSYGGYTALWLNGLEPRFAAVVCSGHFNDWQPKTTGRNEASYLYTENASMYAPGLLTRFNHGDLAALACPRPFLVEAGDEDWIMRREWVEREFARARAVYALHGAASRIELAWEHGGHRVYGRRSFEFLDAWLRG